ncbi:hypothetical protein C8J55DRAFT_153543 [Lentinula edodes]|uniref:Uncharacterized protein n=1 Tax=Lentinula lateritia TaxID=40482 RepID=A0A9W9A0U7_9AGAR|nr:hypothetical protein C8J55DRAFT_153543 [Lentinula edodes]
MFLLLALFTTVWSTSLWWHVRCEDPSLNVPACSSQFDYQWSVNSKGQSPCQVSGYLGSVCSGGEFSIPAITPGQRYSLSLEVQDNCTCSTVYYSALSACASCQGAGYTTWADFSTNCSTVFLGVYPETIPSGTAVPHWAYQAIAGSATFNTTLAREAGDLPESSTAATSTSVSSPSTAIISSTPIATPSTASSDDAHKINAGAIAGGVVGGLAFLCIVILAFIFRHPCRRRKPDGSRPVSPLDVDNDMSLAMPTPFMLHHTNTPLKPYNPSDPETYFSENARPDSRNIREHYLSWSGTSARYSGTAEI